MRIARKARWGCRRGRGSHSARRTSGEDLCEMWRVRAEVATAWSRFRALVRAHAPRAPCRCRVSGSRGARRTARSTRTGASRRSRGSRTRLRTHVQYLRLLCCKSRRGGHVRRVRYRRRRSGRVPRTRTRSSPRRSCSGTACSPRSARGDPTGSLRTFRMQTLQ